MLKGSLSRNFVLLKTPSLTANPSLSSHARIVGMLRVGCKAGGRQPFVGPFLLFSFIMSLNRSQIVGFNNVNARKF